MIEREQAPHREYILRKAFDTPGRSLLTSRYLVAPEGAVFRWRRVWVDRRRRDHADAQVCRTTSSLVAKHRFPYNTPATKDHCLLLPPDLRRHLPVSRGGAHDPRGQVLGRTTERLAGLGRPLVPRPRETSRPLFVVCIPQPTTRRSTSTRDKKKVPGDARCEPGRRRACAQPHRPHGKCTFLRSCVVGARLTALSAGSSVGWLVEASGRLRFAEAPAVGASVSPSRRRPARGRTRTGQPCLYRSGLGTGLRRTYSTGSDQLF